MSLPFVSLLAQTEPTELADIRDPITFYSWVVIALAVVGGFALLAALAYFAKRRRRAATEAPGPPPVAPEIWAREKLDRLERENAGLDDKQFTSEAADILRTYLERAFQVPAPERTTEEFLALIGEHPAFQGALKDALDSFLTRSDLVKFARQTILPAQRQSMLGEARAVIDEATTAQARAAAPVESPTVAEVAS